MEETKNKRKERIKTFLIIFLVLMLILTFCSNTILNYSLPVVSAQYAGYGTITEKVRGSGLITANQNYEVTASGNRTVASVSIKAGDEVRAGQVLFVLEADQGEEAVKTAQDALDAAKLAYQKALLTAVPDYAAENQEIANARADLQIAIQRLNEARNNAAAAVSEMEFKNASAQVTKSTDRIAELSSWLSAASAGEIASLPDSYRSSLENAKNAVTSAENTAAAAQADYDAKLTAVPVSSAAQAETVRSLERAEETAELAYIRAKEDYEKSSGDAALLRAMEDAENAWKYAKEDTETARKKLTEIQEKEAEAASAKTALTDAQKKLETARTDFNSAAAYVQSSLEAEISAEKQILQNANATVEAYNNAGSAPVDLQALEDAVTAQERNVSSLLITLAQTQKNDKLTQQIGALDLQAQQDEIRRLEDELAKVKKNSGSQTITSKNAGVVSAVNFAAGDTVMDGDVLSVITLTDSGYTVQFTATAQQAAKVQVGTVAEAVTSSYSQVQAKLVSIKADPDTAGSKRLTFDITGDVTPGEMVSISISCSSSSYECVVPNSAIMEDGDGKFVLAVTAKSTPLGNRFYVSRAAVKVLASDEMNSAVEGDIHSYDFIVTASEKPLTSGMQVRTEGE